MVLYAAVPDNDEPPTAPAFFSRPQHAEEWIETQKDGWRCEFRIVPVRVTLDDEHESWSNPD
jgi:hypothetical protein